MNMRSNLCSSTSRRAASPLAASWIVHPGANVRTARIRSFLSTVCRWRSKSRVRKFERSDGVNLGEDLTSSSTNSTVSCVGSTCGLTNKDSRRLHVEAVNALKSILLSSSIVSESILVVVSVEDVSMPETPRRLEKDIAASRSSPCKVSSFSSATAIGGVLRSMMKRDPGRSWKPL